MQIFHINKPVRMDQNDMVHVIWKRYQSVKRELYPHGLMNTLIVRGDLDLLIAPLKIYGIFGVGSRAGLGLGAYDLTLYPRTNNATKQRDFLVRWFHLTARIMRQNKEIEHFLVRWGHLTARIHATKIKR